MDWKDISERAFSSFYLTLLATFPAAAIAQKDWATVFSVVCSALAAAGSVVKNAIKQSLAKRKVVDQGDQRGE
jgi:hypothetical protein